MRRKIEVTIDKKGFGHLSIGGATLPYLSLGDAFRLQRELKSLIKTLMDDKGITYTPATIPASEKT